MPQRQKTATGQNRNRGKPGIRNRTIGKQATGKKQVTILMKWKNYGMEHNTWYSIDDFQNVKNAIKDFEEFNKHFLNRNRQKNVPIATPEQHVLPNFPLPEQPRRTRLTFKQKTLTA